MRLLFYIAVFFSLCAAQTGAKAQTTIMEQFIAFNCPDTFDKVELVEDIQKQYDTLVLNCHVPDSQVEDDLQLRTCLEKQMPYNMRDITTPPGTPFTAINGRYLTSSNHSGIHHSAIALAEKENPLVQIPFALKDNTITAELPEIDNGGEPLDLWLYAYIFERKDQILELPGDLETLPRASFTNMVKKLENLGEWGGKPQSVSIPLHDFKADGFALIAQGKHGGPILAIGKIEPGLSSQQSRPQH